MGFFDIFKRNKKSTVPPPGQQNTDSAEPVKKERSGFVGFALLSDASWDKEKLKSDLLADWQLDASSEDDSPEENLVFSVGDMIAVIGMMDFPVPENEAEYNAQSNYLWSDAADAVKQHKAHLMVSVLGESDSIERGKLFVKLMASCCKQPDIIGVYSVGTVFQPQFYTEAAEIMKNGALPLLNWIWFGLRKRESGVCCYTIGMEQFGKEEMEIIDADGQPSDVRDFLLDMVSYVLESDVTLLDGETIGFSKSDKHTITRSEGVSLPQTTLKISYSAV